MSELTISGKGIGARRPLFADWSMPLPPEWQGDGGITLRDVIDRIVRAEVEAFRQRQEDRQVIRTLTAREVSEGAARGKIAMGDQELSPQEVDEEQAVATACQAFEDGIFLVVIDGEDYRQLDREVHLQADSRITFVRLTLLAGG